MQAYVMGALKSMIVENVAESIYFVSIYDSGL